MFTILYINCMSRFMTQTGLKPCDTMRAQTQISLNSLKKSVFPKLKNPSHQQYNPTLVLSSLRANMWWMGRVVESNQRVFQEV